MSDALLIEIDSRGVASVVLNRSDVHNAFDDKQILALTDALKNSTRTTASASLCFLATANPSAPGVTSTG